MTRNWTEPQKAAIEKTDNSVLVSAAAGSGKTAVLTERCVRLVTNKDAPCDVDELLIVTFTDAAAAEMRSRIADRLRDELKESPGDRRIYRQLAMLDGARISTIHSFCRWLLNRYFSSVNLEPRMPLMDEQEVTGLKRDCIKALFDEWSIEDGERGEAFLKLLAAYGKSERVLQDAVLNIAAFLESYVDPDDWLKAARASYEPPTEGTLLNEAWKTLLIRHLRSELRLVHQAIEESYQFMTTGALRTLVISILKPVDTDLKRMIAALDADSIAEAQLEDLRADLQSIEFEKLPAKNHNPIKNMSADQIDLVSAYRDRLNAIINSVKTLQNGLAAHSIQDWSDGIARTAPFVNTLLDAVIDFRRRFSDEKHSLGMLDFSDLERFTLDLLNNEANGVASRMRDKFRHVLVDEFQDTNPVQARILQLISREEHDDRANNLFSVGDVKQSIYRFRLGEPRLFLRRRQNFEEGRQQGTAIALAHNFRSTVAVIDAINAIFSRLMAKDLGEIDYADGEQLRPPEHEPTAGKTPAVEVHILAPAERGTSSTQSDENEDIDAGNDLERIEREAYVIAERIETLHAEGTKYEDMVILLRSMKARMGMFLRRLHSRGIPAVATRSGDLFDALEVLDVISLLRVLDNAQQDIPLASVLRSPLLGRPLTDAEFAKIRTCSATNNQSRPFHTAVPTYADGGTDKSLRESVRDRLAQIDFWRTQAQRRPIADVLWDIYEATGYLAYVSGLDSGARRRANLLQLHDYARKFGDFQRLGLNRFLRFLETVSATDGELDAGTLPPVGDAVQIMTIHGSKGLQFPVVILGEAGKQHNMGDARSSILQDRELGIGMMAVDLEKNIRYATLPHRVITAALNNDALAEEMRVLYVALTRAKEKIVIVGTAKLVEDDAMQSSEPSSAPLPLTLRFNANGYLNWIKSCLLAMPHDQVAWDQEATHGQLFEVRQYDENLIAGWSFDASNQELNKDLAEALADLQPIDRLIDEPVALLGNDERAVLERRLLGTYRHDALTHVPAVASASELKRRWEQPDADADGVAAFDDVDGLARPHGDSADRSKTPASDTAVSVVAGAQQQQRSDPSKQRRIHSLFPKVFRRPSFATATGDNAPTQIGTWTHAFFEYVNLQADLSASGLQSQLDLLITGGVLPPAARDALDMDAIHWFFGTSVGRRLTSASAHVKREWPFTLGIDPTRYDPAATRRDADDIVLVRGIVDCLFDSGDGWEIVDYKTDRVSGDELHARAALYAGQLHIYAQAVEAVWKQRPKNLWLAFLDAREIVEV